MKSLYDMTQEEALAYLRGLEGIQNIGAITQTGGIHEYDPVRYTDSSGGELRSADGGYSRALTSMFDPNFGGGVYGMYEGIYDRDGNLKDVQFRKGERDQGFYFENLDTIGPLAVLGAMGAGAGLFGGAGGAGAGMSPGTMAGLETGLLSEGAATAGTGAAAGGAGGATGAGTVGAAGGAGAAGAGGAGAAGAGTAGAGVLGTGLTAGQAAGLLGAAVGAATSGDRSATSTSQREPWGPAQDWIKDNIARGQALQRDYQANPFSSLQQNAYQNVFSGIDGFANGILPSVFGAVNSFRPYSRTGTPSAPTFNFQAPQRTNYGTLNWQDLTRNPQGLL